MKDNKKKLKPYAQSELPVIDLRPDYTVSRLIKGGWQLAGDHGAVDKQQALQDMLAFYDAGVTAFDCADIYTGVEELLGRFRKQLVNKRGVGALATLKIHTKYVPDRDHLATLNQKQIVSAIDRSLVRLDCERLDLVQFHWWDYHIPGYLDAVQVLRTLQQEGKINRIGVTNFDARHLQELCDHGEIMSAQVQYSLLDRRVETALTDVAAKNAVHLFTYGVLAGGFLTDAWLDAEDPGFEFSNRSLVKYRLIIEEFGGWPLFQALLRALRKIADRHHTSISAVAIKVILDKPTVSACIIGARYADRLPLTMQAFALRLSKQDLREINEVQARSSGPTGEVFELERDTSGQHGRIMKYNINSGKQTQLREEAGDRAH